MPSTKVCKNVVDTICDAPLPAAAAAAAVHHYKKREAEAEADADAQYFTAGLAAPYAAVAPVAHAVAHTAAVTVKHACREVTTEHCADNPSVKVVPVEVKHCHTVTKVTCSDVENAIPKTTCEPVETTHVASYALPHVATHYGY